MLQGGRSLKGEMAVSGSKNAALPILISSLLTAESRASTREFPISLIFARL